MTAARNESNSEKEGKRKRSEGKHLNERGKKGRGGLPLVHEKAVRTEW